MECKTLKVKCIGNTGCALTINQEYIVINETDENYIIRNDVHAEKPYSKDIFEKVKEWKEKGITKEQYEAFNKKHTPTYAEEQLEHAQDKESHCYNKKCENQIYHKCTLNEENRCKSRLKEPINYEEEYNKLKKEFQALNEDYTNVAKSLTYSELKSKDGKNKELEKENEELKEKLQTSAITKEDYELLSNQLENEVGRNRILQEKTTKFKLIESELLEIKKQNNQDYMKQMHITITNKNVEIEKLNDRINNYQDFILEKQTKIEELKCRYEEIKQAIDYKNKYITEIQLSHNIIEQDNNELICKVEIMKRIIKDLNELI